MVQGLSSRQSWSSEQQLGLGRENTHWLDTQVSAVQSFSSVHSESSWQQSGSSTSWRQWKSAHASIVHGSPSGFSGVDAGLAASWQSDSLAQQPIASVAEYGTNSQHPSSQESFEQSLLSSQSDWNTQAMHCETSVPVRSPRMSDLAHSRAVAVHSSSGEQEQSATHFPSTHFCISSQSALRLHSVESSAHASITATAARLNKRAG